MITIQHLRPKTLAVKNKIKVVDKKKILCCVYWNLWHIRVIWIAVCRCLPHVTANHVNRWWRNCYCKRVPVQTLSQFENGHDITAYLWHDQWVRCYWYWSKSKFCTYLCNQMSKLLWALTKYLMHKLAVLKKIIFIIHLYVIHFPGSRHNKQNCKALAVVRPYQIYARST